MSDPDTVKPMRRGRFAFFAERSGFSRHINISMANMIEGELRHAARPLVFDAAEFGAVIEPMMRLLPDEAQALMDELWQVGLRPSEGTGSAGSLAATERHLKDMRSIAFALLREEGVPSP